MSASRLTGTVLRYDEQKGYGMLRGADGQEYFVHHRDLAPGAAMRVGRAVSFRPEAQRKGNWAREVEAG